MKITSLNALYTPQAVYRVQRLVYVLIFDFDGNIWHTLTYLIICFTDFGTGEFYEEVFRR